MDDSALFLKGEDVGVLVRKKKGTEAWYVIVRALNRRCSKKVPDKKTGLKLATQLRKEIALGTFEWPEKGLKFVDIPFGRLAEEFIETAKTRLKPTTWRGYEHLIKLHLRCWKNIYLKDFTKPQITKLLLAKQEQGLNTNNLRICISAVFQFAVERELLQANPAHNLGKAVRNNTIPKKQAQALPKAERDRFLDVAKEAKSPYYVFYLALFKAGLRLGEALALAVEDINWQTNQIHVCRNLTHKEWGSPKSNRTRLVNMSPQLAETLRQYCATLRKVCKLSPETIHLVFGDKYGRPINPDLARVEFHALLEEAGVRKIRLQNCRHTFASILLTEGANIFFVMRQLGHADVKLTCNLYGHLLPENRDSASLTD